MRSNYLSFFKPSVINLKKSNWKMITIKKVGKESVEIISSLAITTFYETYAPYNSEADMLLYTGEHYNNTKITEEIELPDVQYFLAWINDIPVGFAKLRNIKQPDFLTHTRNVEIERIYVLQQFQQLRIGKALIDTCMNAARQQGFEVIWLGVWQQNQHAIHFYEKNGFENFGTHSFLLGEDLQTDFLMMKKL